jgi:molybdate transport system substrate-binding protein
MRRPVCKLGLLVALLFGGASSAGELLVFAASSTAQVLGELGKDFQTKTGTVVRFSFAGSNTLARQIAAGAPADVFLAADARTMDWAEKSGKLSPGSRTDLLANRLVVVAPRDSGLSIHEAKDLLQVNRLSMGDPASVPVGVYAKDWLTQEGVWAAIAPKVVPALDDQAAVTVVTKGAAEAGVVYQTDAHDVQAVRLLYRVPLEKTPAIRYSVAKLKRAGKEADEFLKFLRSERARAAFARQGFTVVGTH